ncbi:MAG: hypothetical protein RLZZ330_140 [Actinomycetota bacterium]|jgi:hypothetical protein
MNEEEFKAPDWVVNETEAKPLSKNQKIFFFTLVAIAVPFCLWAGWFEYHRAQEGHWRAWVYAFEWPFFAVVALYLLRRLLRGDMPKIPRPRFPDEPSDR